MNYSPCFDDPTLEDLIRLGEAPLGDGDRDYNDLVVQLDFTCASGHGWLA